LLPLTVLVSLILFIGSLVVAEQATARKLTLDQYDQLIQEVRPIHEVVAHQPAMQ